MRISLLFVFVLFVMSERVNAQAFPNPATLSTGQGTPGTLDPIWTVSGWFSSNPPNPMGLSYSAALINNNCAPGSWVDPATLPPPTNNGNWITGQGGACNNNTNDGYIYFRLTLNLPSDCNGNSVATTGSYTLYLTGYVDNTITDIFVNGTSTGISGGGFSSGSQLNITLSGPWVAGLNYIDVQVWNQPNGGQPNPYGLLLVANSAASSVADGDGDGVADINDQCPCDNGSQANGCSRAAITGDTVLCAGESTTLTASGTGTFFWNNGTTGPTVTLTPGASQRVSVVATASNGYVDSAVANITVNTLPPIAINPASTSICIGNSATLTGSGGLGYLWSDGTIASSITVSPASTANYSVTGTDINGCTATASSTVTVNQLPIPSVNPAATAICNGDNTTLTASGGTGYAWSDGSTTAAITVFPTSNTTYIVTATDANNCSATTSSNVTVNALPVPVITPAAVAICIGDNTTLTASGGNAYLWSDGSSNAGLTVSPASTATYAVTVTDANNCSATTDATVTVNSLPVPSVSPANVAICPGSSTTFTASGGTTYAWDNGDATAATTVSPATATTYVVTVTDANNCSATASADVTPNTLTVASIPPPADTICNGGNTSLTASGGSTYAWSDGTMINVINVSPSSTTSYTVTVTDANNCTASASAQVLVAPVIALTTAKTDISCNGLSDGSIDLTITGGLGVCVPLWSDASTTEDISGLSAGNYSVTVTDMVGCTATASENIAEPSALALTSSFINPSCVTIPNDGSITLTVAGGTGAYQYNWSPANNSANPVNLGPGNYDVTVSDANACTISASFVLTYLYDFTVDATPSVTIKMGENVTLGYTLNGNAGNYINIWSPASTLSCADCVSPIASTNSTLLYQIELKNDAGCTSSDTVRVTVVPDYTVFVPNAFTPNNDGNNDVFGIAGNVTSIAYLEIQIFNRAGEKVYESQDHQFIWDGSYKGVILNPGVFTWQMKLTFLDGHREQLRKGTVTLLR
jgi:gliding motility-associated-like protein